MKFSIPFLSFAAAVVAADSSNSKARIALLKEHDVKIKRRAAFKRQQLQSASTLRNFKPSFMKQDDEECDWSTEETCYDSEWNFSGCVPYSDGGCPCTEPGEEKCGFDASIGYTGYCTQPEFCCEQSEELCYDAEYNPTGCVAIADGGCACPEGEEKCGLNAEWNYAGYCTAICCDDEAGEETCYDENYNPTGCSLVSEGGCPCPEGEVKCGGNDWYAGTCTTLCCEEDEETCYDDSFNPTECIAISDGGCPCPEGEEKCNAMPEWNYPGWCVEECCTIDQETCFDDDTGAQTCADIATGGCPCPEGQEKCGSDPDMGWAGYCTEPEFCCADDEELCYGNQPWSYDPTGCAAIADGGCDCPDGEVKCGAEPEMNYAGFCTSLCCEEQTCYDATWEPTSCATWEETCPSGFSFEELKRQAMTMIDLGKMKNHASELHKIKAKKTMMVTADKPNHKGIEAEEVALLRKLKDGSTRKSSVKDVPAFMLAVH